MVAQTCELISVLTVLNFSLQGKLLGKDQINSFIMNYISFPLGARASNLALRVALMFALNRS